MSDEKPFDFEVTVDGPPPDDPLAKLASSMLEQLIPQLPRGHRLHVILATDEGHFEKAVLASTQAHKLAAIQEDLVRTLTVLVNADLQEHLAALMATSQPGTPEA